MKQLKFTKRALAAFCLAVTRVFPLASGVVAEEFDVTQHVNPFSSLGLTHAHSHFYGDGKIEAIINNNSPIKNQELTTEDFPLLDIETMITAKGSTFYIILKDKSEKAMVEAIDILYNNYRDIVSDAQTWDSLIGLSTSIGDINGDHWFTLSDVTALLKHLAGWDVFIYTMHADVTHDTNINLADVTYILRAIAKWSDYSLGF